jgi:hypothetical protein
MSYNSSIPVATTSPSVFPAQCQTNWGRLQTMITADHQFNLAAAANDGYHNLVHMQIPSTLPSGVASSLGRLYVNTANAQVNLFYMDDAGTAYQLTPTYALSTQRFVGTANIAGHASLSIFNVAYDYTGLAIVYINSTSTNATYNFMRSGGSTDIHRADENGSSFPSLAFSGTDLQVTNESGSAQDIVWSLMINRI